MAMLPPPPQPMSQSRLEEGLRPGGSPSDEPIPRFMVYMNVISTVTHVMLGGAAFCTFIVINFIWFSVKYYLPKHGYLTIIGYTILMSQAIFSMNPQSGSADSLKYPRKTKLFWHIQIFGSLLVISGCVMAFIYVESNRPETSHLESGHAIVGCITMILSILSIVGAVVRMLCKNNENNSVINALRACGVTMTLALASIAICLGLHIGHNFTYVQLWLDDTTIYMGMALSIITLLTMLIMMVSNMIKRGKFLI